MKDVHTYAEGFRELADFVEGHPALFENSCLSQSIYIFACDREEMVAKAKELGAAEKNEDGAFYFLRRRFGPHNLDLCIQREKICQRVKTGTRKVTVPDPDIVANAPMVEVEEPVYVWKCPESILKPEG